MNINWKLRLQNKTTLVALITMIISVVYKILASSGAVPSIGENVIVEIVLVVIDILCLLGIVVDPTTQGISDSARALNYTEPNGDKKE